jgi:hypothetical protein
MPYRDTVSVSTRAFVVRFRGYAAAVAAVLFVLQPAPAPAHAAIQASPDAPAADDTVTIHETATMMTSDGNEIVIPSDVVVPRSALELPHLDHLVTGLMNVDWDADVHGPLLAVGADMVGSSASLLSSNPFGMPPWLTPPLAPKPDGKYRLPDLADYFWRRIVRLPHVTVLAPAWQARLNVPKPPSLAIQGAAGYAQTMPAFEESLTVAQWQTFAGDGGIGLDDLRPDQRSLFLALIPSSFRILEAVVSPDSTARFDQSEPGRTLSDDERMAVRLCVRRIAEFSIGGQPGGGPPSMLAPARNRVGNVVHIREYAPPGVPTPPRPSGLIAVTPSRLKPQQLDFDAPALAVPVLLAGAGTVDELIRRVRAATGVQIYVDQRFGRESVWMRLPPSADIALPAGETLRALCWAVGGAIRDLGDGVYILTRDIDGYGARVSRIATAVWPQIQQALSTYGDGLAAVRAIGPAAYIRFAAADPAAVPDSVSVAIDQAYQSGSPGEPGVTVPIGALPAALQQSLQKSISSLPNGGSPVVASAVHIHEDVSVSWIVPGVGPVGEDWAGDHLRLPQLVPEQAPSASSAPVTLHLPAVLPLGVALRVWASSPDDAVAAVSAARGHGFAQVWLDAPPANAGSGGAWSTSSAEALLRAAAAAAQGDPAVQIVPVVRVLSIPLHEAPDTGGAAATGTDRNILGDAVAADSRPLAQQTASAPGDAAAADSVWRDLADPRAIPDAVSSACSVASVAGIAGIAFADLAAPGYRGQAEPAGHGAGMLGYTPERRRAFVRSNACDPADLADVDFAVTYQLGLPGFDAEQPGVMLQGDDYSDAALRAAWRSARSTAASQFADALRRALPDVGRACWIESLPGGPQPLVRFVPWRPEGDPSKPLRSTGPEPGIVALHFEGAPDDAAVDAFVRGANVVLADPSASKGGVMIDLTGIPVPRISAFLDRVLPDAAPRS